MVSERTPRFLDGVFAITPLRLLLWISLIAALFPGIFTDAFKLLPFMDDHQFHNWEEADRLSIARYGQFPFWNPFYCGGMVSVAAPENGSLAPDFLLRLLFGVTHGRRFAVVLFLTLGMEGTYRLCRSIDSSAFSSFFAAIVFSTSTLLVHQYLGLGWVNFFGFELVPWVVLGLLEGKKHVGFRLGGACALGWIALAAGTYTAPYTGIAIGLMAILLCLRELVKGTPREMRGWIFSLATIGIGALLLALAKLVPMVVLMRQYPRVFSPVEINDSFNLLRNYTGIYTIVIVLAVLALFFKDYWARLFFTMAVAFFLLAMGQFSDFAPASILKKLPLVSGLRLPDRFMVMFHFFAALTAARGLSKLEDAMAAFLSRIGTRVRRTKPTLLTPYRRTILFSTLGALVVASAARTPLEAIVEAVKIAPRSLYTMDPPRVAEQEFKQHRGNRRDAHVFPHINRGSLYCFVGIPLPESPLLRADLAAEEYPADPAVATVERVSWSPNEIVLNVDAKSATRIFVNQNYSPHWTTSVGAAVDVEKLLGVDVPQGKHVLRLRYRDGLAIACALLSLATFVAILAYFGKIVFRFGRQTAASWYALGAVPRFLIETDDAPQSDAETKLAKGKSESPRPSASSDDSSAPEPPNSKRER